MKSILVGSVAAETHGLRLRQNPIKDIDFFLLEPDVDISERAALRPELYAESFYHPTLKDYAWSGDTASLDELYTIKVSHSYWVLRNGSWSKHVRDAAMMKREGAKLIPELHAILYPIWEELHGKKKANLEQEPEEFFNSQVKRVYEHDSIHAAVAYFEEPLFNRILRDNHQVAVSRAKFEALEHEVKLMLVREEVYATALERKIIPSDFTAHQRVAYSYALEKTITSFTKGWFPTFILDHYEELRLPTEDFVETFHKNQDRLVKL